MVVPEPLARHAPAKKAGACSLGGYVSLQRWLVGQCEAAEVQDVSCPACHFILKENGFEIANLEKFSQQAKDQGHANIAELAGPLKQGEKNEQSKQGQKKEQMPDADNPDEDEDPFSYARQQYPTISLLPPGMAGKAFGYRCNVCRSRRQPGVSNTNILRGSF